MASLRDFFVLNKKRLFIILGILLLVPLIIFVISWYIDSNRISVVNEDPRYTVIYKPTPEFSQTIKDMGLWENGAIYVTEEKSETVKNLEIVFTETPQLGLRQLDSENKLLWSSGTKLENGTLVIFINISSSLVQEGSIIKNNRGLDKLISYVVLTSVNNAVQNLDGYNLSDVAKETIDILNNNLNFIPFYIIYEK